MSSARKVGLIMMAIIRRARARGDKRSHRKFGIVTDGIFTDGIFTDGIVTDGMRMSGLAVVALAYAIATSSLL